MFKRCASAALIGAIVFISASSAAPDEPPVAPNCPVPGASPPPQVDCDPKTGGRRPNRSPFHWVCPTPVWHSQQSSVFVAGSAFPGFGYQFAHTEALPYGPGCYLPGYFGAPIYGGPIYEAPYGYWGGFPFTGVYGSPWLYSRPLTYYAAPIGIQPPAWNAIPFFNQPAGVVARAANNVVAPRAMQPGAAANQPLRFPAAVDAAGPNHDPAFAEIQRRVNVLKPSTPAGRDRADVSIGQGDLHFADQRYGAAASKYRDAIAKAPDYARAHFRLAHCYVAMANFNEAMTRFLIAFELDGAGDRVNFSLAELYRGNKLAKQTHLDRLLDAMAREPEDGELVFLHAIHLHYDQQPFQAREHFVKAKEMAGVHQRFVHHFLPVKPIAEPE